MVKNVRSTSLQG